MTNQKSFIPIPNLLEGDFFQLAGLQNLPEKEKEAIMAKLIQSVQNRVIVRIDDLISDPDRATFHSLLEKGNDQAVNKFLEEKGINVAQLVAEESLLQKNQLLQTLAKLRK